jgi:hypothetical protein
VTDEELEAIIATFPEDEQRKIREAEDSFRQMVDRMTGRGPALAPWEIRAIYHDEEADR